MKSIHENIQNQDNEVQVRFAVFPLHFEDEYLILISASNTKSIPAGL